MKKVSPKPIDIINAAIAEIYGEQAVELLNLFSKLNSTGKQKIINQADEYNEIPRYKKAISLGERLANTKPQECLTAIE